MAIFLLYLAAALAIAAGQDLGYIQNFQQTDQGDQYIELSWDFVAGDATYALHKYSLTTDNDFSSDERCPAASCTTVVDYLEPCQEHYFELVPYFTDPSGGSDVLGDSANTTGYTNDLLPGAASNVAIADEDDDGTTLQWNAPTENGACVDHYEVCFRLDGKVDTICDTTTDTQITMADMQACGLYHVKITPITPSGLSAPTLDETVQTREDVPGPPQDVVVGLITQETIQMLWNDPITNPLCVDRYVITFGETHALLDDVSTEPGSLRVSGYQNEATISPLSPCTNYTIDIRSQNSAELSSEPVTSYAATADTEPLPPPYVIVDPEDSDSILVIWGDNEDDKCAGDFVICWNDGFHPYETCEEVDGGGDNSFIITDLLPCTDYNVIINVVSPGGTNYSDPTTNHTSTEDVAPGPVLNLQVTDVSIDQITITFDAPETDPQCVKEYDINIIDEDQEKLLDGAGIAEFSSRTITDSISGLESCTKYLIRVSAVSPTGKRSPWEDVRDTTDGDVPSAPQELGVNAYDGSSITVQWFQPAENSRCVTEFELSWSGPTNGTETIDNEGSFKMTYQIDGLQACSEYTITLYAAAKDGDGSFDTVTQETTC